MLILTSSIVISYKLFDVISIYIAEAITTLTALNQIIKSELNKFVFFSDSKNVLSALNNTYKTSISCDPRNKSICY